MQRPGASVARASTQAFVGGLVVMGAEMVFARQLAPWFGSSLPVWAVLISVLLLALAVGSALGGRWSLGQRRGLAARLLLASGGGLALAAIALPWLFSIAARAREVGLGPAIGAGLAGLAVAAAPLVLLGALPPALIAGWVDADPVAGRAAGRLGAAATAGSLVGTLLTTFVALPGLGARGAALALAGTAVAAALPWPRTAAVAALTAVVVLGTRGWAPRGVAGRIREARETPYQAAFVVEAADGTRSLRLNSLRERHSHHDPRGPALVGVWPSFLLAQVLRPGCSAPPRRILILGLGAGTLARDLGFAFPGAAVDGVEIDPVVVELGRRWFGLPAATTVTIADARSFLNRPVAHRYDLVLLDAYGGAYLPFQLATRESFARIAARLAPGGAVAVNVLAFAGDRSLTDAIGATMAAALGPVAIAPAAGSYNAMLVAPAALGARACSLPAHPGQQAWLRSARPTLLAPRAALLTDDHAPIEWLTHRAALAALFPRRLAEGER